MFQKYFENLFYCLIFKPKL